MGREKKKRKKESSAERKRHRHSSDESRDDTSHSLRRKHKKHKSHSHSSRRHRDSPSCVRDRAPDAAVATPEVSSLDGPVPERAASPPIDSANCRSPASQVCAAEVAGGGDSSLSIDQTNALRAKLGLKPLDVAGANNTNDATDQSSAPALGSSDTYAIHHRPDNIGEKKRTEKMRDKLSSRRQQRQLEARLASRRALGASDSEDDQESTAAWIERSRQLQQEKEAASKRAAMLDDLDNEFGVGSLVEQESKISQQAAYSSADLVGLQVAHSAKRLQEGREVILTLEDRNVLDEEAADKLVNVNIVDDERHEKNVQLRKQKTGYRPEDNEQWDDDGNFVEKSLLSQYDEELHGVKRATFTIGRSGCAVDKGSGGGEGISSGTTPLTTRNKISAADLQKMLREKTSQSLQMAAPKIASDFYTEEEMTQFKRVKKKVRKVRRKVRPLKADDLVPLADESSRHLGRRHGTGLESTKAETVSDSEQLLDTDDLAPVADLAGVKVEPADDDELQVQEAMERSRRLQQLAVKTENDTHEERLLSRIKEECGGHEMDSLEDVGAASAKGNLVSPAPAVSIVLNTTAEFCRSLGDIPTYGRAGNRDGEGEDLTELELELAEERAAAAAAAAGGDSSTGAAGAWAEVGDAASTSAADVDSDDVQSNVILEEEPLVGSGLGGALQLAVKKGYVESECSARKGVSQQVLSHLRAKNYSIDDKSGADEDRGRRGRGGGGASSFYNGPVSDFNEKRNYRPNIHLDYVDDQGRMLSSKEAFRYLSHKFHGKGSGKIKTEKREKKFKEDRLMEQMNSTDTPLNTLSRLQEKQKQLQSPFVVLSGNSLLNTSASLTAEK